MEQQSTSSTLNFNGDTFKLEGLTEYRIEDFLNRRGVFRSQERRNKSEILHKANQRVFGKENNKEFNTINIKARKTHGSTAKKSRNLILGGVRF